jgi:hypothetical protein
LGSIKSLFGQVGEENGKVNATKRWTLRLPIFRIWIAQREWNASQHFIEPKRLSKKGDK